MKRIFSLLLCAVLTAGMLAVFTGCGEEYVGEVNIYNWGLYMPRGDEGSRDLLEEFEKQYKIKVNYKEYDSNEVMYADLKAGNSGYDLVFPSDYMIARMIEEGMAEKINYDNVPNYVNIMEDYKNAEYDPTGEYSVPYTWGTVGIIYNKTMVTEPVDSWDILWNEKYENNILMFDNSRDAFGIALKKLGYSQNTTDEKQLQEATEALKEQKPLVQAYVMDQIFDKMGNGEAALAPYYAGDAITMIDENSDLAFAIPKEGTNRFVDAMVIPKGAPNKENAEKFINFMCDGEIAAEVADYIGYSTPNSAAYELLDDEVKSNEIAYPSEEVLKNTEFFLHLPAETNQKMQDLWVSLKTTDKMPSDEEEGVPAWIVIAAIAVVIVIVVAIVLVALKKKAPKKKIANKK